MFASIGDRLVVQSNHVGVPLRAGEIVGVQGAQGAPPYLVRWSDSGQESLMYPGPDAYVEHQVPPPGEI